VRGRRLLARVLRAYANGPDHLSKLRVQRFLERLLVAEPPLTARFLSKYEVRTDLSEAIEREVFFTGSYERASLEFIGENLSEGDFCVCSGSAYGYHMIVACEKVGQSGQVLGIDPQPLALARTRENLLLNGFDGRFSLCCAALGNKSGWQGFTAPRPENRGGCSIPARQEHHPMDFISRVASLEEIIRFVSDRRVRLLVLDVEGFEAQALESMGSILPDIILFELHPYFVERAHVDPEELFKFLKKIGYTVHKLDGIILDKYDKSIENNFVAITGEEKCKFPAKT